MSGERVKATLPIEWLSEKGGDDIKKDSLINNLKIAIALEKFYHNDQLRQLKREEEQQWENIRHSKEVENIYKRYDEKLKYLENENMLEL